MDVLVEILNVFGALDSDAMLIITLLTIVLVAWFSARMMFGIVQSYLDNEAEEKKVYREHKEKLEDVLSRLADANKDQIRLEERQLEIVSRTENTVKRLDDTAAQTLRKVDGIQASIDELPQTIRNELKPLMSDLRTVLDVVNAYKDANKEHGARLNSLSEQLYTVLKNLQSLIMITSKDGNNDAGTTE